MRAATIMVAIGELEELPLRLEAHQVLLSSKPPSLQGSDLGTAECAERSAAPRCGVLDEPKILPVLLRLFNLLSSSSSLHAFNFFLQFLSSIFCIVFGCLGRLFLPSISSPSACAFRRAHHLRAFFLFFLCFLPSIFLLFFRLVFFAIFDDPKNQATIGKILLRKRFFG